MLALCRQIPDDSVRRCPLPKCDLHLLLLCTRVLLSDLQKEEVQRNGSYLTLLQKGHLEGLVHVPQVGRAIDSDAML